jgi:hypothetical protein
MEFENDINKLSQYEIVDFLMQHYDIKDTFKLLSDYFYKQTKSKSNSKIVIDWFSDLWYDTEDFINRVF